MKFNVGNCGLCRHWELHDYQGCYMLTDAQEISNLGIGVCHRVKPIWECTKYVILPDGTAKRVLLASESNSSAFVEDGEEYHAALLTRETFGCVLFEMAIENVARVGGVKCQMT